MSFRGQLFASILVVSIAIAAGMWFFMGSSIREGFWDYVEQRAVTRLQPLVNELADVYRERQSWDALASPARWHEFRARRAPLPPAFDHRDAPFPPPETGPDNRPHPGLPLFLLDARRQPVSDTDWPGDDALLLPIDVDGATVGYLGLPPPPELRDYHDEGFLRQQTDALLIITGIALAAAVLVALILSHLLTNRIRKLVGQVRHFSLGQYDARLVVAGHDELNVLTTHLNDLGASLRKSEQAQRQWVADTSHELRTPIAVLQADLESMEDGIRPLDPAAVTRLLHHVGRLKHLIDDLYELSLSDIGALSYRKEACNLAVIAEQAAASIAPACERAGLAFSFQTHQRDRLMVLGDSDRLGQLLLNLLNNAQQHTHAPGQVILGLEATDGRARIVVEDSPPGVPEPLQARLFERLYRVDPSRSRNSGGAGLGLSLCHKIVEAHHGSIDIASSSLGGLRVTVSLPLAKV
ncbi:ATP-binding protein [Marinobacter bohaiensis]|uniref:ATP-binding protein n=1 Tax=Marinobacter bohaiensis TaxID=2201898 RepID=UPI000DABD07A|nr:ATP-binding protein [Marinobacter bohaiensis]